MALREPPGALDELVVTSGAAIDELLVCETGAAIFADGRTVGRCAFTGSEALSDLATSELPAPADAEPAFEPAAGFAAPGFVEGCDVEPVGAGVDGAVTAGSAEGVVAGAAAETVLDFEAPSLWEYHQ
jgi:hypothetical protein